MTPAEIAEEAVRAGASQKLGELTGLLELVDDLAPDVILEIGSMWGDTLQAWKTVAPDALLISVSLSGGPYGGGAVREGITDHHIDLDSHSPETRKRVIEILAGRPVDFLFIDGDHSYSGVSQDFAMYGSLVRKGGVIALHDILFHSGYAGVQVEQFWLELVQRYETTELVEPHILRDGHPWGGIGVVHV